MDTIVLNNASVTKMSLSRAQHVIVAECPEGTPVIIRQDRNCVIRENGAVEEFFGFFDRLPGCWVRSQAGVQELFPVQRLIPFPERQFVEGEMEQGHLVGLIALTSRDEVREELFCLVERYVDAIPKSIRQILRYLPRWHLPLLVLCHLSPAFRKILEDLPPGKRVTRLVLFLDLLFENKRERPELRAYADAFAMDRSLGWIDDLVGLRLGRRMKRKLVVSDFSRVPARSRQLRAALQSAPARYFLCDAAGIDVAHLLRISELPREWLDQRTLKAVADVSLDELQRHMRAIRPLGTTNEARRLLVELCRKPKKDEGYSVLDPIPFPPLPAPLRNPDKSMLQWIATSDEAIVESLDMNNCLDTLIGELACGKLIAFRWFGQQRLTVVLGVQRGRVDFAAVEINGNGAPLLSEYRTVRRLLQRRFGDRFRHRGEPRMVQANMRSSRLNLRDFGEGAKAIIESRIGPIG